MAETNMNVIGTGMRFVVKFPLPTLGIGQFLSGHGGGGFTRCPNRDNATQGLPRFRRARRLQKHYNG